MTLEQKREIIIKNKDPALAALEAVTDRIYNLTDPLLDNKESIATEKIGNYDAQEFVETLRKDASKYEKVRQKLLSGDFNLSLTEINYVALAFHYSAARMRGLIVSFNKAIDLSEQMVKDLMSPDNKQSEI